MRQGVRVGQAVLRLCGVCAIQYSLYGNPSHMHSVHHPATLNLANKIKQPTTPHHAVRTRNPPSHE